MLQAETEGTTKTGAGKVVEVDPQASEEVPETMVAPPNSVQLGEPLPGQF